MQHFPIFVQLANRRVVVSGGGAAAVAKLRLLLKTQAKVEVFSLIPCDQIATWARDGVLSLTRRPVAVGDLAGATLVYAADEEVEADKRVVALGHEAGVLVNVVDNLEASDFITPAIVDRAPVTVAIGTEGAAPVLARAIKADLEERLPSVLGLLARVGKRFRAKAAVLAHGRPSRDFWSDFYFRAGPKALDQRIGEDSETVAQAALETLLDDHLNRRPRGGHVHLVGAGPGDPELLTLKARKLLHEADVVIHDGLVSPGVLELCRREATILGVGKSGFGPSAKQGDINALMVEHARNGAQVVRLKGGDPVVFGRLDEEIETLDAHGIAWTIVPGITAASAGAAALGQSLTRRGRNSEIRFVTAHDVAGFADQDWLALSRPGAVTAVYMGKRAARFVQGRMLMHGATPATPVSIVERASCTDQRIIGSTLAGLSEDVIAADLSGPALIILGLAPRGVATQTLKEAIQ